MRVAEYWEDRYAKGGTSGPGSRGREANHKAAFINKLITKYDVGSVVDWGCGDGVVAEKIKVHRYVGLDVSEEAIRRCRKRIQRRRWHWLWFDGWESPALPHRDLALSLDVILHLVDDELYRRHLELLLGSAPLVCIYSSNRDERGRQHVLHRKFSDDLPDGWEIVKRPSAAKEADGGFWVLRRQI